MRFIGQWNLDDLSRIMQIPSTVLRRKINFWESQYLISQVSPDVFQLIEKTEEENLQVPHEIIIEDESESAMASTQDQREEELQVNYLCKTITFVLHILCQSTFFTHAYRITKFIVAILLNIKNK